MTDLIERLRQAHLHSAILRGSSLLCKEAADELERLQAALASERAKQAEPVLLNLALRLRLARRCLKQAISSGANQSYIDQLRGAETEAWNSFQAAKAIAVPPADDEAVRLLREASIVLRDRWFVCAGEEEWNDEPVIDISRRIDAYLAKVGK